MDNSQLKCSWVGDWDSTIPFSKTYLCKGGLLYLLVILTYVNLSLSGLKQ